MQVLANARLGLFGALSAITGMVLSGPVAMLSVNAVHPQPPWQSARVFADNYHAIQMVPYAFGFLFVGGCVVLVAALRGLAGPGEQAACRLGLLVSALGATFIFFNYVLQTTFVPALVRANRPEVDVVISSLTMVNPASLAWALEMWGYGFLGLGSWLAAPALDRGQLERAARWMLAGNGVISLVGTATTVAQLDWVLGSKGVVSYIAWNVYFLGTLVLVAVALRRRHAAI